MNPPADNSSSPLAATEAPRPSVARVWRQLRERWWIPLGCVALCLGAAAAHLFLRPASYTATARLWVSGKIRMTDANLFSEEWQSFFGTQIELLQGAKIQQRAYARLQGGLGTNDVPDRIEITQPRKTTILQLQARSPDAAAATAFLNAVMDEYLNYRKEVRLGSSDDTLASLADQISRQEKELKSEEEKLHAFQRENNLAVLQEQGASAGNYLGRLNVQLADLRLEAQLLDSTLPDQSLRAARKVPAQAIETDTKRVNDALLPANGPATDYLTVQQQLELLKLKRADLSKFLRPEHPKIIKYDEDIARTEKLIAVYRDQSKEQVAATRESLNLKISSVEGAIRQWEVRVLDNSQRMADGEKLKASVQRAQALYDRLLHLLQNLDVNKMLDQELVSILDRATVTPPRPRVLFTFALAFVVGLTLALGIVLFLDRRDDRISSLAELRREFSGVLLGVIPETRSPERGVPLRPLRANDDRHAFAEAYRNLRSALVYPVKPDGRPKTMLITSAVPDEGKSTVAINLAHALAFAGARVLLIDGDLRRGNLHTQLRLAEHPGLTDLHDQETRVAEMIAPGPTPNLFFLPHGQPSAQPGELFLRPDMDQLLHQVRSQFDYILIDSAPILATADTASLAPKTDGVLFVVRAAATRSRHVRHALELLAQRRVPILGLVFNRTGVKTADYDAYNYPEYQLAPTVSTP